MASTISRIGQHRRRPRWLAQGLDDLLARRPGQAATWLYWLLNAPQSAAERNILRLIGLLAYTARRNIQRGSGCPAADRKNVVEGQSGEERGDPGRSRLQKTKK